MDISAWTGLLGQLGILALASSVVLNVLLGLAVVSFGRIPLWVGVVVSLAIPILGLLVLLVVAITRAIVFAIVNRKRRRLPASDEAAIEPARRSVARRMKDLGLRVRVFSRPGIPPILALLLIVLGAASTLLLQWYIVDLVVVPRIEFRPWGSGLEIIVILSVASLFVALLIAAFRPSRLAAAFVGTIGVSWAFLGATALLLNRPLQATLAYAETKYTESLGWAGPWVTSSIKSLIGARYADQVTTIQLEYNGRLPSIEAGPALPIIVAVGLLSIIWAFAELAAAHRAGGMRLQATNAVVATQ